MAWDPVCNEEVDEHAAEFQSSAGGATYFFCSEKCMNEFNRHPEDFVESAA